MNIKLFSFVSFALAALFLLGACQKRRARATLEGDWNVVGVSGIFISECSLNGDIVEVSDTLLGTISFSKNDVTRDYILMDGEPNCFEEAQKIDEKEWRVTDYENVRVAGHLYEIEIGDEEWSVIFGEDRIGERAKEQDFAYLAKLDEATGALYIEVERAN